jgi:hypothetical protein
MTFDLLTIGLALMAGAAVTVDAGQSESPRPLLCEPWGMEYTGDDATGEHVIALWQFKPGAEQQDSSLNDHNLILEGATISPDGKIGSCVTLESYRGWPEEDARHAAIAPNKTSLTPKGAFTIEMWIKPKSELEGYPDSFLIDKKYVSDDDYQIILGRADKSGRRRLRASLGFGADSATYYSEPAEFEQDVWYHIAFVYDGAGKGSFFINGVPFGSSEYSGRRSISPGKHHLSIGDRIGSYYHGFPGFMDQVRICQSALEFRRAGIEFVSDRTAFVRMEKAPSLRLAVVNFQRTQLADVIARVSVDGMEEEHFALPEIASGDKYIVEYSLDTRLRPGEYRIKGLLEIPGDRPYQSETSFPVVIAPREPPHRIPVLMWGVYGAENVLKEMERLKRIGFTHVLGLSADYGKIWEAGQPTEAQELDRLATTKRMLNEALAGGISVCASLSPGHWAREKKEFLRVDRAGEPYKQRPDICGLFPQLKQLCYNVGASVAQTYGRFPAFDSALIHTEVRDSARPCFHDHDRAAFREFSGFDIPPEVAGKNGVRYQDLEGFPESRVIADDHPIYVYYKWYWKHGDGWNALNTAVHEGLKSTGSEDLWTFHDPAVRVASVYGSGGMVDVLSQWTYSYPDPIRIATATDELLAMAAGAEHPQQVMKMTQIIWYRSQTAPASKESEERAAAQSVWEDTDPDAAFITIHPMQLREAFWTKMARPIKGIMYHGWQSLVPVDAPASYRYTHPQTQHELTRLINQVVEPLGPTLLQVPGVKSDVAFLESFASEMFAGRGTYGWGGSWAGDAYLIAQYAQLQPEIIFDETIMERGLEGFRMLVMMDCDVITQTMADRIKAFQQDGGIVIGDDHLCPAIKPDIVVESYKRTRKAAEDKAALQERAAKLREQLDPHYTRCIDSSNPDVITYLRRYGSTDYIFAINDHRESGNYVGHHGLVMEHGLPSDAVLTVSRREGVVYDLIHSRRVPAAQMDGKLRIEAHLEPCDGWLFMITEREISAVCIEGAETTRTGETVAYSISVVDKDGKPIDAVVPVKLDILDPDGRPAEFSGFYGAAGGALEISVDIAPNDVQGIWAVRVEELASGQTAIRYMRVE